MDFVPSLSFLGSDAFVMPLFPFFLAFFSPSLPPHSPAWGSFPLFLAISLFYKLVIGSKIEAGVSNGPMDEGKWPMPPCPD